MPAEIVTMLDCASNYGIFEVKSPSANPAGDFRFYTVTWHGSEGGAHCTCEAYKYSKDRHCKHIDQVWKGGCFYNPQWKDGVADPQFRPHSYTYDAVVAGEKCPGCGGPMVAVRRAV